MAIHIVVKVVFKIKIIWASHWETGQVCTVRNKRFLPGFHVPDISDSSRTVHIFF